MKLADLATQLGLENLTPEIPSGNMDIQHGYVSDLLSDVLAHAPQGGLLVTVQVHLNVIAVAVHAGLAAIVFAADRRPDDNVQSRAAQEGITLFATRDSAFDVVGRLHELGVRGLGE